MTYAHYEKIQELGIRLFTGHNTYNETIPLTDYNYFSIYERPKLEYNLDPNACFFQTSDISKMLYKYIQNTQNEIKLKNPFCERYNSNNDLCVHIRLTDVAQFNPGLSYYLKTIAGIEFDTLYISTDDTGHEIIQEIQKRYPQSIILDYKEVKTIQFASTCKHIVLSHGSFSAMIGFLSFFSDVHYPKYEPGKIWYGDIFSIDGWIENS